MSSSSSVVVAGTQSPGSSTLDQRMELAAHLHVQQYVLLFGCSTVSQGLNPQKAAFADSVPDGSLGGQARALAHFAHFPHFT